MGVEQLDAAITDLADPDRSDPPDAEAIHDARKRLKKTRSLIRLARADLGPECARQINGVLRDAGRARQRVATPTRCSKRFSGWSMSPTIRTSPNSWC